jgi:hypothetical protein
MAKKSGMGTSVRDQDDDYGWEVDLTLSWDAMDNVNYALALAYMDAGDLYAQTVNAVNDGQPFG